MQIQCIVGPAPLRNNTYVVWADGKKEALVIAPASSGKDSLEFAKKNNLVIKLILNTHGHHDHIFDDALVKRETGARIAIHSQDAWRLEGDEPETKPFLGRPPERTKADVLLKDGDVVGVDGVQLQVLHTPGHVKGCVCFYSEKEGVLFSGDTLFAGAVGRTDLPASDEKEMVESLRKLVKLPPETAVYPGHGRKTLIGMEKGALGEL
jgi:hydroxyacylglutathione hydrolase